MVDAVVYMGCFRVSRKLKLFRQVFQCRAAFWWNFNRFWTVSPAAAYSWLSSWMQHIATKWFLYGINSFTRSNIKRILQKLYNLTTNRQWFNLILTYDCYCFRFGTSEKCFFLIVCQCLNKKPAFYRRRSCRAAKISVR